jgi:hypothetical protein
MKKLTITLLASMALATASYAGTEIHVGKDAKSKVIPPVHCFNDQELQLDVFGAYQVGEGPDHAGPIRDHGWGGGIGINYFFSRYIGIGVEGYWIAAKSNSAQAGDRFRRVHREIHEEGPGFIADIEFDELVRDRFADNDQTTFHNIDGMVIFRLPIDEMCLAPYAFLGGGAVLDGDSWAVGFGGVGLEYRVVPNKIGIFVDSRWNYYGDRYGHGDQNNFTTRAGIRWVF